MNRLLIASLALFFSACVSARPILYTHTMEKAAADTGEPSTISGPPYVASFRGVTFVAEPDNAAIKLSIENNSNSTIRIDWGMSSFILPDGSASPVGNGKIKPIEFDGMFTKWAITNHLAETVLPPSSSSVVYIYPMTTFSEMQLRGFPPLSGMVAPVGDWSASTKEEADVKAQQYIGRTLRLSIASGVKPNLKFYSFTFRVSGYSYDPGS